MPAGADGAHEPPRVGRALFRRGEDVQGGAVVPEVVQPSRLPRGETCGTASNQLTACSSLLV